MCRQDMVELEYGMPMKDVVRGYRDDGYSWAFIAGVLNYSVSGFLKYRKRNGLIDNKRQITKAHPYSREGSDQKAQDLDFSNMRNAVIHFREAGVNVNEIADRLSVSIKTVCNYTPDDLKYMTYTKTHERWNKKGRWSL